MVYWKVKSLLGSFFFILFLVDIQINKKSCGPLSCLTERYMAENEGRKICKRLASKISAHTFVVDVQAVLHKKIIARERVKALYKNVVSLNFIFLFLILVF